MAQEVTSPAPRASHRTADRIAPIGTPRPIPRTTISDQVAAHIARTISEGKWKPGQKIPSEPILCQTFEIGRSSLREALKALSFAGIVEIRQGDGTYVSANLSGVLSRVFLQGKLTEEKVNDLCEARIALESELAALCARRATDEDLASLESYLREMRQSLREAGDRFLQLDLDFHLAVADASKNRVLADSLRTIRELLHELIKKSQELPRAREIALARHAKILEALKQRDPRKARNAMRTHLEIFHRQYKTLLHSLPTSVVNDG